MKTTTTSLYILGTLLLASCAGPGHQRLIVDNQSNLFNGESLLRVAGAEASSCYKEDLASYTKKAREQFEKGAKSAIYWSEVGNCLAWHDELREARFFLGLAQDVAKSKEEEAMVKNNIAVIYLRQGRTARAYDLFKEARSLAPRFVTPTFNLAQLYVSQNINQEALKLLAEKPFATSLDPEVLHLKGLAYLQQGQVKEAGEFLVQIPAQFHKRGDFALTLAQWQVRVNGPEKALELLERRQQGVSKTADQLAERVELQAKNLIKARELAEENAKRIPAQESKK